MKNLFDWRLPVLAIQFLTRLPTPQIRQFEPALLARSVAWFPAVGLLLGAIIALSAGLLHGEPWLAALVALVLWVWVTGGLHLDGLADMADGLGAAHRDPTRFLAVLKDPHLGSFGVLSLIVQTLAKLILLLLCISSQQWAALILIPAWARSGVFSWQTLPALAPGMAAQFGWQRSRLAGACWWLALALLSLAYSPLLLAAPLVLLAYRQWLLRRLGGVTGDCLGAGIEISETLLLLLLVVAPLLAARISAFAPIWG